MGVVVVRPFVDGNCLSPGNTNSEDSYCERYHILNPINKGVYGHVYRALDNYTRQAVAIKHELHGLTQSTLREINILKSLPPHPCIVSFKEAIFDEERRRVLVVMEYLPSDLGRFIHAKTRSPFPLTLVKSMMRQILEGVHFLHCNHILHRDLKPANILINDKMRLKICDFGLSRKVEGDGSYTPGMVTPDYRAPELLLGEENYSSAVDMWSVGCIMGEIVLGQVLFKANSDIQHLACIHQTLVGSCNVLLRRRLIDAAVFGKGTILNLAAYDLMLRLLEIDPSKRITAQHALNHVWFNDTYPLGFRA